PATGVYANQPSPTAGSAAKAWRSFILWAFVLLVVQLVFAVVHSNKEAFSQRYSFTQLPTGENSFVTDVFELGGHTSNAEVEITTDLDNNWAYFQLALVNTDNGQAYDFSRQVSYYHGRDSDGDWTEGKAKDVVVLSSIPPGRYYLRVEPEMDTATKLNANNVRYQVKVHRDVTTWAFFFIGFVLLPLPTIYVPIRSGSFEGKRCAESDYAPSSSGGGGGDD